MTPSEGLPAAGCRLVWVVDPQQHTVTIHRSTGDVQIRTVDETLDGGDVVTGFGCTVADIFASA
ncbi:MAG: Uma2 family endonuclease [Planctomycetes bacterium]|nr:Uma2 family endonuclease [Planctomycetota bacterium]